jgi:hypothetical protein
MTQWGLSALVSPHCFAHLKSGSKTKKTRRLSRELGMSVQGSIVIGGGAFAGLALALALRQGLGPEIPVIVADPALSTRPSRDPRATAIVAACRRLFEAIGAWDDVRGEAQHLDDGRRARVDFAARVEHQHAEAAALGRWFRAAECRSAGCGRS